MSFTNQEFKTRLNNVKKSMQKKGIDLLISHDTANMYYLTGYDAWSFYYAQCVLVHVDLDEPLCFVRAQDAGGAFIKTYLKKENIIIYNENYIHKWPKHPYDYLVQIIKERKWDKLSIGLEMDAHYFTAFCFEKIKNGFTVLLEIEVEGARQIKNKFPNSLSIFLLPPDKEELEKRIRNRGTEKEEAIKKRLLRANYEISVSNEFDFALTNYNVDETAKKIIKLIKT